MENIINKGIIRYFIGGLLNFILLVIIWLLLGEEGKVQYELWKDSREKKNKRKRAEHKYEDSNILLEKWRTTWINLPRAEWEEECEFPSGNKLSNKLEKDMMFCRMFYNSYYATKLKAEKNKRKNFFWKKAFLVVLCIGMALFLVWSFETGENTGEKIEEVILKNGVFLFGITLLCHIVAKWIDVKKYQETWARHSAAKYALECEMLLFISQVEPYHTSNRKKVFLTRSIEIWNTNQSKFGSNLENREKELTDVVEDIKSWVGL